jgi:hypothetical protein
MLIAPGRTQHGASVCSSLGSRRLIVHQVTYALYAYAPAPSTSCWRAAVWQRPRPTLSRARPRWSARRRNRWPAGWIFRRPAMALHPQPMDRVHPHVARLHPWRSSRSASSCHPAYTVTASLGGRRAPCLHQRTFGPWVILPGALGAHMVAMDSRVPRQRLQHRLSHPTTDLFELGDRLGCLLSHRLQPWYGHLVTIFFLPFFHCCWQWRHPPGYWHWLFHPPWPLSPKQCSYSS